MAVKVGQGPDGRIYLADGVRRGAVLSYEQVVGSGVKLTEIKEFDAEKFNQAYKPNVFSEKTCPLYVAQIDRDELIKAIEAVQQFKHGATVYYVQFITEPRRTSVGIMVSLHNDMWEFSAITSHTFRHFPEMTEALVWVSDQILGGGK